MSGACRARSPAFLLRLELGCLQLVLEGRKLALPLLFRMGLVRFGHVLLDRLSILLVSLDHALEICDGIRLGGVSCVSQKSGACRARSPAFLLRLELGCLQLVLESCKLALPLLFRMGLVRFGHVLLDRLSILLVS